MPSVLGSRAMAALADIQNALGLDYAGIDFGLSPSGDILLFEANATMTVAAARHDRRWDYRRAAVQRVEDAVRQMFIDKARAASHIWQHRPRLFEPTIYWRPGNAISVYSLRNLAALAQTAFAQQPARVRPQRRGPANAPAPAPRCSSARMENGHGGEHGVTQDQVSIANLELKLYGLSSKEVQVLGNAERSQQSAACLDRAVRLRPSLWRCAIRTIS